MYAYCTYCTILFVTFLKKFFLIIWLNLMKYCDNLLFPVYFSFFINKKIFSKNIFRQNTHILFDTKKKSSVYDIYPENWTPIRKPILLLLLLFIQETLGWNHTRSLLHLHLPVHKYTP